MIRNKAKGNKALKRRVRSFLSFICASLFCTAAVIPTFGLFLPESIAVYSKCDIKDSIRVPLVSLSRMDEVTDEDGAVSCAVSAASAPSAYRSAAAPLGERMRYEAKLLGILPLGHIDVDVYKDVTLYPGGMSFGVKLATQGVLVVGLSDIETENGKESPAYNAGLRTGDVITKIGENSVNSVIEVTEAIEECDGEKINLTVDRDGESLNISVTPAYDGSGYKAGVWVRDSTAGIGTVTYIVPDTGAFAGLGHGIFDIDTGKLVPLRRGTVNDVIISGIKKGRAGAPGELQGYFGSEKLGSLMFNRDSGVYGVFASLPDSAEALEPMPIGLSSEITEGDATIRCTLDGDGIKEYSVKITQISHDEASLKNFVIEVTDPVLIEKTGGIVQGMSGSPVIQSGKLVGAVTHVMIGEPTRGYGIFIENMLKNMPDIMG